MLKKVIVIHDISKKAGFSLTSFLQKLKTLLDEYSLSKEDFAALIKELEETIRNFLQKLHAPNRDGVSSKQRRANFLYPLYTDSAKYKKIFKGFDVFQELVEEMVQSADDSDDLRRLCIRAMRSSTGYTIPSSGTKMSVEKAYLLAQTIIRMLDENIPM